jgi:hypothetical protein
MRMDLKIILLKNNIFIYLIHNLFELINLLFFEIKNK